MKLKLECFSCEKKTIFDIEGNIKICNRCGDKFSYKKGDSAPASIRERKKRPVSGNEASAYWNWTFNLSGANEASENKPVENARANPDSLPEEAALYKKCPRAIKEKFDTVMANIEMLSTREKQVVQLLWEGKTMKDVAVILDIQPGAVSRYLLRAREKLSKVV